MLIPSPKVIGLLEKKILKGFYHIWALRLASGARGPRFDPRSRRGKFRCPNTLSLVSFAGMTLDKCIVLRIGTLTGCPLCMESHPLCRLKNPTVISIWLLVGFHPATRSVQSTPADNTRKRVWQYIEKERKKERPSWSCDQDHLNKLLFPCPKESPYEI